MTDSEPSLAALADLRLRDYAPAPSLRRDATTVSRAMFPAIDIHNHLGRWLTGDWLAPDVRALCDLMDEVGVVSMVNLDGRWGDELGANLERYDAAYPGRFLTFCHLDWTVLQHPKPTGKLISSLEHSRATGARGLKIWKDLGLTVTDAQGELVLPDDPRLADVFAAAGALALPVLIHTADPVAFFAPLDERNERLEELVANPDWWYGRSGYPSLDRLIAALENVVSGTPATTFIAAHVGVAEDLAWVDRMLETYPNFHVEIGGRLGELGRRPRAVRRLMVRHSDRVLFGTDAFPPDREVYRTYWRFLETEDECFAYAPGCAIPPQGRWDIAGVGLSARVLRQVYADNARRLLGAGPHAVRGPTPHAIRDSAGFGDGMDDDGSHPAEG